MYIEDVGFGPKISLINFNIYILRLLLLQQSTMNHVFNLSALITEKKYTATYNGLPFALRISRLLMIFFFWCTKISRNSENAHRALKAEK